MKARVYYDGGWWYGEVYADWLIGGEEWRDVTLPCFTKLVAIIELKFWLRQNKTYDVLV